MPLFAVHLGTRLNDATCDRIGSLGLSPDVFPTGLVRPKNWENSESMGTVFIVDAPNQKIAKQWRDSVFLDLGAVTAYEPPAGSGEEIPPDLNAWARVGRWTKDIGNSTTTISSLPSQPRGLIVWGSGISAADVDVPDTTGGGVVFGFSDGTTHRDMAYVAQNGQTTTNTNTSIGNVVFHMVDPTGTNTTHIKESATASFASTSFSLNWSGTTLETMGNYFVFGGSDIIESEIHDFEVDTTTAGTFSYTGLGFAPDGLTLMLFPNVSGGLPWPSSITGTNGAMTSISAHARGSPHRSWSTTIRNQDNQSVVSSSSRLQRPNYLLSSMTSTDATEQQYCRFVDLIPADGFRLEWFNPPSADDFIFTGLFVQGGYWDTGYFNQPSTGPGTVKSFLADRHDDLQAIMGLSVGNVNMINDETGAANAHLAIGAQDSTGNKTCLSYFGRSFASPTAESSILSNKFMRYIGD